METRARWEEARERFLELAELPAVEGEAELARLEARDAELAGWVRELLRHDPGPSEETVAGEASAAGGELLPKRFGPYEALRVLGEGGMGRVYVARRADGEYEHEVAVKLMRGGELRGDSGPELVQRFLRERQTLAQLDHEYIPRLLDGGSTEAGEPYFVMELVEGEPCDAFAARLDLRQRLELFERIGQAVAHAHECGVVHRDLKPANVLVRPDGTPRLLDFGIARPEEAIAAGEEEALTRTGHRLFTPEYASPEQVRGERATTQSDVFSLGILLYVFLCGKRPWPDGDSLHALERAICEDDPPPPSRRLAGATRRRVAGDLDAITLACLEKQPVRRYASVEALVADVRRQMEGEPILARRTGVLGRGLRFARRRPIYPVTLFAALGIAIAGFFALGAEQRAEERAEQRAEELSERPREELKAAVADRVVAARSHWSEGDPQSADQQLEAALAALEELPDAPALEAEVLTQMAVFANLRRDWERALPLANRALAALASLESPDPVVLARLYNTRAYTLFHLEPGLVSEEASRVALEHARANLFPGDVLRADALMNWADELKAIGDAEGALAILAEAIAEIRALDPKNEYLSQPLNERGVLLAALGRPGEAAQSYREALDVVAWHRGGSHASLAKVRLNLGSALFVAERFEEAREELELCLDSFRQAGEQEFVGSTLHVLGRVHAGRGDLLAAEELLSEALQLRLNLGDEAQAASTRCFLGLLHARAGRSEEARSALEPILASPSAAELLLPDVEGDARHVLGDLLAGAGEVQAARPHWERALLIKEYLDGPNHPDCIELRRQLSGD